MESLTPQERLPRFASLASIRKRETLRLLNAVFH
jgi:hypothetical protein